MMEAAFKSFRVLPFYNDNQQYFLKNIEFNNKFNIATTKLHLLLFFCMDRRHQCSQDTDMNSYGDDSRIPILADYSVCDLLLLVPLQQFPPT